MQVRSLVLIFGLLFNSAQATTPAPSNQIRADYSAVPSLRQHLPINISEAESLDTDGRRDLECLSWNLYFEARGGTPAEQIAIARVPINRTSHSAFSQDICTNVFQYHMSNGRRRFQFSWAGIHRRANWRIEAETWIRVQRVAYQVYLTRSIAHGPTFFHNANISDNWAPRADARKVRIGSHLFWRS